MHIPMFVFTFPLSTTAPPTYARTDRTIYVDGHDQLLAVQAIGRFRLVLHYRGYARTRWFLSAARRNRAMDAICPSSWTTDPDF